MSLYAALAGIILWGLSVGGSFLYGRSTGEDHEVAAAARDQHVAEVASAAAASAAASAIAGIEVKNVYTTQKLQTEVRTNTVFAECHSGTTALQLLNSTVGIDQAPRPVAPGGTVVPASGPAR